MSLPFVNSETRLNLMRAFAGESQARNRYTFAAGLARRQGLYVLEEVFTFTANQEQAHAKAFYDQLQEFSGQTIQVDGTYPVDLFPDVLEQLRAAVHNEYQEWEHDYARFAAKAEEEGFSNVCQLFRQIASIEKVHGQRFSALAELMAQDALFVSPKNERWMCLNCGHMVEGTAAPAVCPVCRKPQGYFIRSGEALTRPMA